MTMKDYTAELIEKAKAAKSAEELLALAKENNVELTEQEAKTYFEQLSANGALSDEELDLVSGGGCPKDESESEPVETQLDIDTIKEGDHVMAIDGTRCQCGNVYGVVVKRQNLLCVACRRCPGTIHSVLDESKVQKM
jgi:hypothetical protein